MSETMDKPEVKAEKAAKPKKYKVVIHSGEDKGEKGDVVLAHNFKQILIQRDKEVQIDERFLEVLKHSVIETTVKDDGGKEQPVRIPRFSYSVEAL